MKAGEATADESAGGDKARSFGGGGSLTALDFLTVPSVAQTPLSSRIAFLETKGFSETEISIALRLADELTRGKQQTALSNPRTGPGAVVGEGRERDMTTKEVAEALHAGDQPWSPSSPNTSSWSQLVGGGRQGSAPWGGSPTRQLQLPSQKSPPASGVGFVPSRSPPPPPPPGLGGPGQDGRVMRDLASMMAAIELAKGSSGNGSPSRLEQEGYHHLQQHPQQSSSQQQHETARPVSPYLPAQQLRNEQQQQQQQFQGRAPYGWQEQQQQQQQQMRHGGGGRGGLGMYPPHHHHNHQQAPPHHLNHHAHGPGGGVSMGPMHYPHHPQQTQQQDQQRLLFHLMRQQQQPQQQQQQQPQQQPPLAVPQAGGQGPYSGRGGPPSPYYAPHQQRQQHQQHEAPPHHHHYHHHHQEHQHSLGGPYGDLGGIPATEMGFPRHARRREARRTRKVYGVGDAYYFYRGETTTSTSTNPSIIISSSSTPNPNPSIITDSSGPYGIYSAGGGLDRAGGGSPEAGGGGGGKEKAVPTIHPSSDAATHNPATNKGSDDALPWFKTIASGRVQKHLMRFVNNFISQQDLEDELGLYMADVFYETETGPTMMALYDKLERRVAERCPSRLRAFREEALQSLAQLMQACEEREEQQERGREALKTSGQRGKPVRNAAKRLGKSRTEARKLGAMIAHYQSLSGEDGGDGEGGTVGGSGEDEMGSSALGGLRLSSMTMVVGSNLNEDKGGQQEGAGGAKARQARLRFLEEEDQEEEEDDEWDDDDVEEDGEDEEEKREEEEEDGEGSPQSVQKDVVGPILTMPSLPFLF